MGRWCGRFDFLDFQRIPLTPPQTHCTPVLDHPVRKRCASTSNASCHERGDVTHDDVVRRIGGALTSPRYRPTRHQPRNRRPIEIEQIRGHNGNGDVDIAEAIGSYVFAFFTAATASPTHTPRMRSRRRSTASVFVRAFRLANEPTRQRHAAGRLHSEVGSSAAAERRACPSCAIRSSKT